MKQLVVFIVCSEMIVRLFLGMNEQRQTTL